MTSHAHHRSYGRLAVALSAAGLLGASLPGTDGPARIAEAAAVPAADPAFDPLLDTGPDSRLRPGRRQRR